MAGRTQIKPLTAAEKSLVEENIWLATWGAGKLKRRYGKSIRYDDLLSLCHEALIYAAKGYRSSVSKFSTYAFYRMRALALRKSLDCEIIDVPAMHNYDSKHHRGEDGEYTEVHKDAMRALAMRRMPSDRGTRGSHSTAAAPTGIHVVADPSPAPEEQAADREAAELLAIELAAQVARLDARQADVIRRCVVEDRMLQEVATDHKVCRERIRQIREDALEILRRRVKVPG